MDKKYLFLIFLIGAILLGFIIEWFLKKIKLLERIRNNFLIYFLIFIVIASLPCFEHTKYLIGISIVFIIVLIMIKKINNSIINYFSDAFLMILFVLLSGLTNDKFMFYLIIFLYLAKHAIDFLIFKMDLDKCLAKIVLNILIFIFFKKEIEEEKKKEEEEKKKKKEQEKKKKEEENVLHYYPEIQNEILNEKKKKNPIYFWDDFNLSDNNHYNSYQFKQQNTMKINKDSPILKLIAKVNNFIGKSNNKKKPKTPDYLIKYDLDKILNRAGKNEINQI